MPEHDLEQAERLGELPVAVPEPGAQRGDPDGERRPREDGERDDGERGEGGERRAQRPACITPAVRRRRAATAR
jgi:hypothetical protein